MLPSLPLQVSACEYLALIELDLTLCLGIVLAALAWASLFLLGPKRFWSRAVLAGTLIGAFAIAAQRDDLLDRLEPEPSDIAAGVVAAVGLYVIFWLGNRILGRVAWLSAEVAELYMLRRATEPINMLVVLTLVAACEELFWRGFVQQRAGFALALAAYTLVHVWARKPVLLLAALAGGLCWGLLYQWTGSLVAPLISHVLWDLAIVVYLPLAGRRTPTFDGDAPTGNSTD